MEKMMRNIRYIFVLTLALLTWNSAWAGSGGGGGGSTEPKDETTFGRTNVLGPTGTKSSVSASTTANYYFYANAKTSGAGGKVYMPKTFGPQVATQLLDPSKAENVATTAANGEDKWVTTGGYSDTGHGKSVGARWYRVSANNVAVAGVYVIADDGYRFLGFGGDYSTVSVNSGSLGNRGNGKNNPDKGQGNKLELSGKTYYYYGVQAQSTGNWTSSKSNSAYPLATPFDCYATFGVPTINGYITNTLTEYLDAEGISYESGDNTLTITITDPSVSFTKNLLASITDAYDQDDFTFTKSSTNSSALSVGDFVYDLSENPGRRKNSTKTTAYDTGNIPITITSNRNGTHTATITITSLYDGATGNFSTQTFTLTLIVNLTPTFNVATNYDFGEVSVGNSKSVALSSLTSNLSASATNCVWSIVDGSAFSIEDGNIKFTPKAAGGVNENVTLRASYTDAGGNVLTHDESITLNGTGVSGAAVLDPNDLAFIDPLIVYTNTTGLSPITGGNGEPISITLSGTDYLTTDGTTLSGKAVGSTHVTITQPASATVQGATVEADVDVIRHTSQLVLNPGQIVYPHQSYVGFVATDNTDVPTGFTASLTSGDASLVGSTLNTNEEGTLTLHVSQTATANYEALDVTKTIYVVANPTHVPVTMSQNLFNNSVLQNHGGEDRNILIENFVVESNDVAWTGSEWTGSAYSGTAWTSGAGNTNQFTMKETGASVTYHFAGVPDVMSFTLANRYGQTGTLHVEQSVDNSAWTLVEEFTTMGAKSVMLSPYTRYVRFTFTTTTGVEQFSVQGLNITEGRYLRLATHYYDYMQQGDESYADQQIAFSAANWGNLSVESSSADFSASLSDNVASAVWDRYVEGTLTVSHTGTADAAWIRILRDAGTPSEALVDYVRVTALPRYIEANVEDVIYTGQDLRIGADDATIAGRQRTFENTFGSDNNPLFDKLYVFGVTRNMDGAMTTEGGVQYPSVTASNENFGSNAKIPCYIYTKSGSRYVWSTTIDNMNVAEKNAAFKLSGANGEKLYFTGTCGYATIGWGTSDEGVFQVAGASGKRVDIYLENCSITSRSKHSSGKVIGGLGAFETSYNKNYPLGAGGVFVFESTTSGFSPNIHIRGTNYLKSTEGVPHSGDWHWSAPIEVKVTNETSVTNLTMDDLWPVSGGELVHTNGQLDFAVRNAWSRSINIGSAKTKVTFDGGYYRFAPTNASATGSMYPNYQPIGYSALGGNYYGCGQEQVGGTVIINDGTFSLTGDIPADGSSPACGTSPYKGQPAHLRFPQNTTVNGGSFMLPIVACRNSADPYPGQAVKNKHNDNLIELPLTASLPDPERYNAVSITLPDEMAAYYESKGDAIGYGQQSLRAKDGTVTAMLPADVLGLEDERGYAVYPWVYSLPSMTGTVMGTRKSLSGDAVAANGEKDRNHHLIHWEIDDRTRQEIANYQLPPEATFSGSLSVASEALNYSSITTADNKDYVIRKDITMMIPIVADLWYTFTAPFDVNKVSIMEIRSESKYEAIANDEVNGGISKALNQQAADYVDWMAYMVQKIFSGTIDMGFGIRWTQNSTIDSYRELWRKYCLQAGINPTTSLPELTAFTGSNWDANYFLYEPSVDGTNRSDYWTLTNGKLNVNWIPAQPETENEGEPNEQTYVMRRGRTYAMQFPYCPGCKAAAEGEGRVYEEEWDYWTGKYLVLEGDGPQTIWGSNSLSTNMLTTPAAGTALFSGNASFGKTTVTNGNVYYHNEVDGDFHDYFVQTGADYVAKPGQGFLLVNPATGAPARSYPYQAPTTGAEVNRTTGIPTIGQSEWRSLNPTSEDATKVLINGEVYILRAGKLYTLTGMPVY